MRNLVIPEELSERLTGFSTRYRAFPRMSFLRTTQEGFKRAITERAWHSSKPFKQQPGDLLRISLSNSPATPIDPITYFRVTQEAVKLGPKTAEHEWRIHPFRSESFARRHNFFPHVLSELEPVTLDELFETEFVEIPLKLGTQLVNLARELSYVSDCDKRQFGAVILGNNGKLTSIGYNHIYGSYEHPRCEPCIREGVTSGTRNELCHAIHAEQSAVLSTLNAQYDPTHGILVVAGKEPNDDPFVNDIFYCTLCSRMMDETTLLGVVTDTSDGPKFRRTDDIVRESFSYLAPPDLVKLNV